MTTPRLLGRAATAALAVLALTAVPGTALAAEGGGPVELEIGLSGPSEGVPGGTGAFTVSLTNAGQTAAPKVRVTMELPAGVSVASVGAAADWTCVLGELSCELQGGLPPGAAAPSLPVELAYAEDARGRQELFADAYQGEDSGAMRIDRAAATVVLTAPAPPPAPAPSPTTAAPQPAPPTQPTVQPAAPAPVRTAARPAAHAPAPAVEEDVVEDEVVEVEPVAATSEETAVPESLPFVDETPSPSAEPEEQTEDVALSARTAADDGVDGWLVALFSAAFLVFGYCVIAAIAKSRRV